jgi:hypothetical protein
VDFTTGLTVFFLRRHSIFFMDGPRSRLSVDYYGKLVWKKQKNFVLVIAAFHKLLLPHGQECSTRLFFFKNHYRNRFEFEYPTRKGAP